MSLVRYTQPLRRLYDLDRYFDDVFSLSKVNRPVGNVLGSYWRVDGNKASLELEMPGFKKEDIQVKLLTNKTLKVSASNNNKTFDMVVNMPKNGNPDTLTASLEYGILTLESDVGDSAKEERLIEIR